MVLNLKETPSHDQFPCAIALIKTKCHIIMPFNEWAFFQLAFNLPLFPSSLGSSRNAPSVTTPVELPDVTTSEFLVVLPQISLKRTEDWAKREGCLLRRAIIYDNFGVNSQSFSVKPPPTSTPKVPSPLREHLLMILGSYKRYIF